MKRRLFWITAPVAVAILILAAGCAESPTAPGVFAPADVEASFSKDKANEKAKDKIPTTPTDPTGDDETMGTTGTPAVAVG